MTNLSGANLNSRDEAGPKGEGKDSPSNFPKYSEYKNSEVQWLGDVPVHWEVFSLKRAVEGCVNGIWGSEPSGTDDTAVIRVADFERSSLRVGLGKLTYRDISEKEYESRSLSKGDLLIEKSGGGDKTLVGCVVLYAHNLKAVSSNFVARMRPLKNFDSTFLSYCFDSLYKGRVNYPSIKQTTGIQNLDSEAYLQERFCFPTLEEQIQIARFLDHETAKIDALIREQERLIELLQEKRQAVISHAVTKGLDPNVPMKDSGVEWLGEVPAHWEICPVKFLVSIPVTDGPHETPEFLDDGILFVSAEAVSQGVINFDKARLISKEDYLRYSRKYKPERNDIYMVKSGATTGVTAINETDNTFNIWSPLAVIRCSEKADPYFVLNAMRSQNFQESVVLNWNYGTQQNIGMGVIENLPIATPPLDEQVQIRDYLSSTLKNWNSLEIEADLAVEILKERRSALISAAVTGKIDVRDWQPPADEGAFTEETCQPDMESTA